MLGAGRGVPVAAEARRLAALYVAHPAGPLSVTFACDFLAQGWSLRRTLVWVKDSLVLGQSCRWARRAR